MALSWPGNVRELANTLERAAILAEGEQIMPENLVMPGMPVTSVPTPKTTPASTPAPVSGPTRTLAEIEREAIEQALTRCEGNRRRAAEQLGIGVRTLYDKLKRYELK